MDVPNADSGYGSTGSQHACPSPTNLDKEGRKSGGRVLFSLSGCLGFMGFYSWNLIRGSGSAVT